MHNADESHAIDYSRKWYAMAAVAMSIFLATIDGSIVIIAMPTFVRELNTTFPTAQWIALAYMLTIVTLLVSVGRLADMVGKKQIYTAGVLIFTVGSGLCGLAPSVYWLIGFRVIQAIGASMTMALGAAIITEAFPPYERGKALGLIGSIVSIGVMIGPPLGGILIDIFSWQWIFFVNLPVGAAGVAMALAFLPNMRPPESGQRFDFPGAITLFISLSSLLLALTVGQNIGFAARPIFAAFGLFAVFLVLFVVIELRATQPMLDLRLFKRSLIGINLAMALIVFVCTTAMLFLFPFYLENILGYQTRNVGFMLMIIPLFLGLVSPIAGSISDKVGTRKITVVGLLILGAAFIGLRTLDTDTTTIGYLLAAFPIGLGSGVFQSPNNSAVMGDAPRSQLGVVSGLLSISRVLGQTMGIAVGGAIWGGRVMHHAGQPLGGDATNAAASAQVAGLHDTLVVLFLLMVVAIAMSIWAVLQERKQHDKLQDVQHPQESQHVAPQQSCPPCETERAG